MDICVQELNITELRQQKRPLWMSDLGIDNYADIIGGGGDIYTDRLPPAFPRHQGMELTEAEEMELGPISSESEMSQSTSQEFYSRSEQSKASEQYAAGEKRPQSDQPRSRESAEQSGGLGVGVQADVEAKVSGVTETVSELTGTVKKTAETVTEPIAGVAGSLTGLLRGKGKKKKDK